MLTGNKSLARTSEEPGKTRTINHYMINESWYIVDLPGYGFARTSKSTREKWETMIHQYLQGRLSLMNVFLLIDSRITPQASDLSMANKLGLLGIPFTILFTKSDKISSTILEKHRAIFRKSMEEHWEEVPRIIVTSSKTSTGKEEILKFIEKTNPLFKPQTQDTYYKKPGKI